MANAKVRTFFHFLFIVPTLLVETKRELECSRSS
jgi:hypothetical protein